MSDKDESAEINDLSSQHPMMAWHRLLIHRLPHCLPRFLCDWLLTHFLTHSLSHWLTHRFIHSVTDSLTNWVSECVSEWVTHSLTVIMDFIPCSVFPQNASQKVRNWSTRIFQYLQNNLYTHKIPFTLEQQETLFLHQWTSVTLLSRTSWVLWLTKTLKPCHRCEIFVRYWWLNYSFIVLYIFGSAVFFYEPLIHWERIPVSSIFYVTQLI